MEPMTLAMMAALQAGGAAAEESPGAIGSVLQARALRLTPEEELELTQLQLAERAGEAALTAEQQAMIRQRFLADQGAAARELQAAQLQAAAARGAAPATAGREIFLAEQAAQQQARLSTQERNLAMQEAEAQARAEREARIAALKAREREAKLARAQAITAVVGVPLSAIGQTAGAVGQAAMAGELDPALFAPPAAEDDGVSTYATGVGP